MTQPPPVPGVETSDPAGRRDAANRFPCGECGANLTFKPGTDHLVCPYCGHRNEIAAAPAVEVEELDFEVAVARMQAGADAGADQEQVRTLDCDTCGASFSFDPNVSADACPFCSSPMVASAVPRQSTRLRPRSLLPFAIERTAAREAYRAWVRKLWFAPAALAREARTETRLTGVYLPFWTYDAETVTRYSGERGVDYETTESYTEKDSDGQTVTKTRNVTKTRWYPADGTVWEDFDDILVPATDAVPPRLLEKLEPWDLGALVPYEDAYLSGFRVNGYTVDLKQGFRRAREIMDDVIRDACERDIGGDKQRISEMNTHYRGVTFKHTLLPVWLSAYRFRGKTYQFMVNARTGEVQGERPWSWWKISLAVLAGVAVAGGIVLAVHLSGT